MRLSDWVNAGVNLAIGVLLGSAVFGLVRLAVDGFWVTAVIAALIFAGFFLFMKVSDKILDRLFTIGVKPSSVEYPQRRHPLLRRISLPGGFILGLMIAMLGLDTWIL